MAISITHAKVSEVPDTSDTSLIRPSDWNAEHVVSGGTEVFMFALSDEVTPLAALPMLVSFRMPYAFAVTEVRGSLVTAQTSGSLLTIDINEEGVSILSTKLTIDNTERTSTTATTPAVISDGELADDAEITMDIDTVGDGTAVGLKVTLIGHQ